jgi:hypothetical protein
MVRLRSLGVLVAISLLAAFAATPADALTSDRPARHLPAHVFAPYFETYAGRNLAALSRRSGAEYLTLAFLQTPRKGSCKLTWDGDRSMQVAWSTVKSWAKGRGLAELSFWALQRDNGGCPGTGGSDSCSGLAQDRWRFSHIFEPFTGR